MFLGTYRKFKHLGCGGCVWGRVCVSMISNKRSELLDTCTNIDESQVRSK